MKRIFEKYPLFLVLLPVFILFNIENDYHFLINYSFLGREIFILFITPILLYVISLLIFRSSLKASVYSFVLTFFFYFLGEIKDFLAEELSFRTIGSYTFVIPASLVIIAALYFFVKRSSKPNKAILFINSLCTIIIVIELSEFIFFPKHNAKTSDHLPSYSPCIDCEKPDIYYIIFDSYSSSSVLASEFGYTNSAIESFLTTKGFQIINNSRSNYNLTPFCIASTFNLNYIKDIDTAKKYLIRDYHSTIKQVYNSELFSILEKQGYIIYNHSIFDIKGYPSTVPHFDEWETRLIYQQHNIIKKMYNEIGWNFPLIRKLNSGKSPKSDYIKKRDTHDSITLAHLHKTIELSLDKPKFVYGHIFLPHSPYSVDSLGNKIDLNYHLSPDEDKKAYVEQLIYSNKLMKDIVAQLFPNIKRPAVFIIQGDHGYRFFDANKKQLEFPNFNAVYFPVNYNISIPDSISGVNTFRFVLNTLFKQKYPLLSNQSFYLKYN